MNTKPLKVKHIRTIAVLACLLAPLLGHGQLFPNLGGSRVGISALTFLKNDVSPRSLGLGGANATLAGNAFGAVQNPAQAAENETFAAGASSLVYGSGLAHSLATAVLPIKNAGNFYTNIHSLNMGPEKVRTEFAPQGTGEYFTDYSLSAEVGYARNLSNRFSIGVGLKFVREQLAQYAANGVGADIGFLYRTDWRNMRFGACLQNFGTNSTLQGNYSPDLLQTGTTTSTEGYPAPTLFKMGASLDALRQTDHLLTVHAQLNHPNDNSENLRFGAEYTWATMLMLRTGIKLGVDTEPYPTAGLGFAFGFGGHRLQADYGLNPTRYLGLMHSIGLSISLAKPAAGNLPTAGDTPSSQN